MAYPKDYFARVTSFTPAEQKLIMLDASRELTSFATVC